jgi:conjugal transfer/entry exclusion protein
MVDVARRVRVLTVVAVINGALALVAIGLIVWINAQPVFWFPKLATRQQVSQISRQTNQVSSQVDQVASDVSGLKSTVGNNTSIDDYATRLDSLEQDVQSLQQAVGDTSTSPYDLSSRVDTICGALDSAYDLNLNVSC